MTEAGGILEFYPQIRQVHITAVCLSGTLFALRGPAKFLSAISYTLYLTHAPFSAALEPFLPRAEAITAESITHLALRAAICFAGALVMYVLFERQTPQLRRWLRARFLRTPAPRAAE